MLSGHIEAIREGLASDSFQNEAAVSQGIVQRLPAGLGWPVSSTQLVWPQYPTQGLKVDYALCCPPNKPRIFIEVKRVGQADGAERQLFEYAFHGGVPFVVLTDGREWNFFVPAGSGDYEERRVYKLDLVDRDIAECASRLERYLTYESVCAGQALQAAQDDYRSVERTREIQATLPQAWEKLISGDDELLAELIADYTEDICGFRPEPDDVAAFLTRRVDPQRGGSATGGSSGSPAPHAPIPPPATPADPQREPARQRRPTIRSDLGFTWMESGSSAATAGAYSSKPSRRSINGIQVSSNGSRPALSTDANVVMSI